MPEPEIAISPNQRQLATRIAGEDPRLAYTLALALSSIAEELDAKPAPGDDAEEGRWESIAEDSSPEETR